MRSALIVAGMVLLLIPVVLLILADTGLLGPILRGLGFDA